jgi:predicted ATPase
MGAAGAFRIGVVPLVGRKDECEVIKAQLQALVDGQSGALLIQGEAGIGKSRLVAETLALAHARGFGVAQAVAQDHERDRPFAPIVAALGLRADASDPRRAHIGAMLHAEAATNPLGSPAFVLNDAIVSLLVHESGEMPMVLAVDDLQWADRSSLIVLRDVLHADGLRVLVLVTRRLYPISAEIESLVAAVESIGVVLNLEPLDRDALVGMPRRCWMHRSEPR